MEKEVKKTEEEIISLNEQLEKLGNDIDLEDSINPQKADEMRSQYAQLYDKLESTTIKSEELKNNLETLKLNPGTTSEAQQLQQQIDLANSKLSQTKEEANQTKDSINKMLNQKSNSFGKTLDDIKTKLTENNSLVEKFGKRISRLVTATFIFNLLRSSLTNLRNGFFELLNTNDQFRTSLNQIKANLMTAFAPIYNAALPAINALMNAISILTGTIAKFIASLFGQDLSKSTKQAKKLSGALNKVSKSGEKASGSLANFDTLQVISETGGSSAGGGGGESGSGIDYDGEIKWSEKLLETLNRIRTWVSDNQDLIIGFVTGLTFALIALKLGFSGLQSVGIFFIVDGVVGLIKAIGDFKENPSWENFGKVLLRIGEIVGGLGILFGSIPAIIIGAIVAIVGLIIKYWDEIWDFLKTTTKQQWEIITATFRLAVEGIKKVLGAIGQFFKDMWTAAKGTFNMTIDAMKYVFSSFGTAIKKVISSIGDFFKSIWNGLVNIVKSVVNTIKSLFTGLKNALTSIFSAIGNAFKSIFDGIWNVIKKIINGLIGAINTLIGGLNKIKFDVPDWVPGIGGKTLGFNIPKIPKLATGAVIPPRQEFAAILGDQKHGTNIEAPLDTIKQANREVLNEFFDKMNGMSTSEKEIVFRNLSIIAQFGDRNFQKLVIDSVRASERDMGKSLFVS